MSHESTIEDQSGCGLPAGETPSPATGHESVGALDGSEASALNYEAGHPRMPTLGGLEHHTIEEILLAMPDGANKVQDVYPLSPLQEGMLFHHLLNEQDDSYVLSTLFEVRSASGLAALINALERVIDRHQALRTAVLWEKMPQPVQIVYCNVRLPVREFTLDLNCDVRAQLDQRLRANRGKFNLRNAPLMMLEVAEDPNGENKYAILRIHHIVCDYRAWNLIVAEAFACTDGRERTLKAAAPYRNYVAWALEDARSDEAKEFFRRKFAGLDESTAPFGLTDVHSSGVGRQELSGGLGVDMAKQIRDAAREQGVSPARLFHAAWGLVVAHTAGREDVVYGTSLTVNRSDIARDQSMVGLRVNTLPLRLRIDDLTTKQFVAQTDSELSKLLIFSRTSLTVAQSTAGTAPLFTSLLNYRHAAFDSRDEPTTTAGIRMMARGDAWTNYPIVLTIDDETDDFLLTAQIVDSVDPGKIITYVRTALQSLVDALAEAPQTPALCLPILPEDERRQVLSIFNATQSPFPKDKLIHELFTEQVQRTPTTVALQFEGCAITYQELNDRSSRLARHLRSSGLGTDDLVGIFMDRSLELIVGVLGIVKAGCAYVPLDPSYPADRLSYMVSDAAPRALLTRVSLRVQLPVTDARIITLDEGIGAITGPIEQELPLVDNATPSDAMVYVIYTSGSTGRPKGTAMTHRSMVNLLEWHKHVLPQKPGLRVLQFAALSFDVSFQEIFTTLCTGGTLLLLDEWLRRDARALLEFLIKQKVERVFLPPIMLQSLAEEVRETELASELCLRDVITAGEQLRVSEAISSFFLRLNGCRLHNHYGPTETHVVTALTLSDDPRKWPVLPSIGQPISNNRIYVLDSRLQPVPLGVKGEIYIAGANVARGYLNRPDLTAARFMKDPISADPLARMYKTGDLGQWRTDGTIQYLGRNDDQVKVRGYRIELAEIEQQLTTHDHVKDAVVVAREDAPGPRRLVGYVTLRASASASVDDLRAHLQKRLPEYMVPAAIVIMDRLPLTPSGKVSRRALPAPHATAYANREYVLLEGVIEQEIGQIWRELLCVDKVGRNDNFFELGGHSLHGIKVIARIEQSFSIRLPISALFQHPTVKELAQAVESLQWIISKQEGATDIDDDEVDEGVICIAASDSSGSGAAHRTEIER